MLRLYLDGVAEAANERQLGRAWLAWTTAALGRVKKFPKWPKFAGVKAAPSRRQTPAQMEAIARQWASRPKVALPAPRTGAASRRVRERLAQSPKP